MNGADTPRELRRDAQRNQLGLLRAATAAVHREGPRVRMATVAADAGVGIGTLYRHFPTREDLLAELTHRSFAQVLANARSARDTGTSPIECLRLFVDAAISQRNELVLPLHGGPAPTRESTRGVRDEIRDILREIIEEGARGSTMRGDINAQDIVLFGAMLAQPRPADPDWDATCRRMLTTYLRGLRPDP